MHLEAEAVTVRIGGFAAEVLGRSSEGIRVKVPAMPVIEGKPVPVEVSLGRETARPGTLVLGHLPLVTGVDAGQRRGRNHRDHQRVRLRAPRPPATA